MTSKRTPTPDELLHAKTVLNDFLRNTDFAALEVAIHTLQDATNSVYELMPDFDDMFGLFADKKEEP